MPFEIRAWKFLIPVVGALFLTTACSGSDLVDPDLLVDPNLNDGDSDVDTPPPSERRLTSATDLSGFFQPAMGQTNIFRRMTEAVREIPDGGGGTGGIVQTSNTSGVGPPDVEIAEAADGRTTFRITNLYGIALGDDDVTIDTTRTPAADIDGLRQNPLTVDGGEIVTFVSDVAGISDRSGPAGQLHLWLTTDTLRSVGRSDDYLAYGFWIYNPWGPPEADTHIGAFVDRPRNSISSHDLVALTGSAVYSGEAEGLYYSGQTSGETDFRYSSFEADARFDVNFDGGFAGDIGEIQGQLTNFRYSDGRGPTNFVIDLEHASNLAPHVIQDTPMEGGFFTVDDRGAYAVATTPCNCVFGGSWGGKFYGGRAGVHPDTLAGTFGTAALDAGAGRRYGFLGVYWAHRQSSAR